MSDEQKKDDQKEDDISMDDIQNQINELETEDETKENELKEEGDAQDQKDKQIEDLKNALARSMADMQNYKRRSEEDRSRFIKFANIELLKEIIPSVDNFNRSTDHLPEELKNDEWVKGVVQIHDNLLVTLEKIGVKKIKTVGEKMDPTLHEALITGPGEKDMITEEFESGFTYHESTLKAAKVKVGNGEDEKDK